MVAGEVASIATAYRRISKCASNMYIDAYIYIYIYPIFLLNPYHPKHFIPKYKPDYACHESLEMTDAFLDQLLAKWGRPYTSKLQSVPSYFAYLLYVFLNSGFEIDAFPCSVTVTDNATYLVVPWLEIPVLSI